MSEETGEEVPSEQIIRGVEISKGRYVIVDPNEVAPFVPLATKTIEVEEFVNLADIDPIYFETGYYVAPDGGPGAMKSADSVARATTVGSLDRPSAWATAGWTTGTSVATAAQATTGRTRRRGMRPIKVDWPVRPVTAGRRPDVHTVKGQAARSPLAESSR